MKKKKIIFLREVAKTLPVSVVEYTTVEKMTGRQMLEDGIPTADGSAIIKNQIYDVKTLRVKALDHIRRLKRAYIKDPENFYSNYISWFTAHHKEMFTKYPQMFKKIKDN